MVSKVKIKGLDFETIEDYFEYILDSIYNGQPKQAKELFFDLSGKQKLDFYNHLKEMGVDLVETLNVLNI